MSRLKMCLHRVYENYSCEKCDDMVESGKVKERLLYSQQSVWQIEQKAMGRCEICGKKKGECPSKTRCVQCLSRDITRHRKKRGTAKRRWRPGIKGRPRYISGAEENFARQKAASEKRMREGV